MAYLDKSWVDLNWLNKANYEESSESGLPTEKMGVNLLFRYSKPDKCTYVWQGDGNDGSTGFWSKGMGGSGLSPQMVNANFKASINKLYLCDVTNNSITVDMSNFVKLNTSTQLYECSLNAGDYFEVYIIKGDSTLHTVTLNFSALQNTPYNYSLNIESNSGSDFIFDSNSYFRFTYSGDSTVGFKINSMTGSVPKDGGIVGTMIPFAGFTPPTGYFFTDGASKARTDYEELFNTITFSIIGTLTSASKTVTTANTSNLYVGERVEGTGIANGTTIASIVDSTTFTISNNATITGSTNILVLPFGALTSTTFKLPDLKGKMVVMPDNSTEFKASGMTGGQKNYTLTSDNLAPHTHGYQYSGTFTEKVYGWTDQERTMRGSNEWTAQTSSVGNAKPFSILNPYLAMNWIIKY